VTLLHQVLEATRTRDDDVDTASQSFHLRDRTDTAVNDDVTETESTCERFERLGDLSCEFTCRDEDETTRMARCRALAILSETGDERKDECERLAASRTASADDVETSE
jgi:hypothetical protein